MDQRRSVGSTSSNSTWRKYAERRIWRSFTMNTKIIITASLTSIIVMMLLTSCTSVENPKQCTQDSDCVPAQCCHATDAVNKDAAPNCQGKACTLDCAPNTLDCGQGEIKCIENTCTAVILP